jgi:hypothetical protein
MTATAEGNEGALPRSTVPKERKIRDSCDGCSSQKIRCTKEKPACKRCASKGLVCEYSVSRRSGKRTRSVLSVTDRLMSRSPNCNNNACFHNTLEDFDSIDFDFLEHQHHDTPLFLGQGYNVDSTCTTTAMDCSHSTATTNNTTNTTNTTNTAVTTPSIDESVTTASNYFDPHAFGHMSDYGDCLISTSTRLDNNQSGSFSSSSSANINMRRPSAQTTHTNLSASFGHEQVNNNDFGLHHPPESALANIPAVSRSLHQNGRSPDCTAAILQLSLNMHVSAATCNVSGEASSRYGNPLAHHDGDPQDINAVLNRNREAIDVLNRVLDCTCSADPTCILACYLAVSKLFIWYAAAVGLDSGRPAGIADLVVTRPVFMGSIALNHETLRLVRASIVLQEIQSQVQPLVAKLSKRQPPDSNTAMENDIQSPATLASKTYAELLEQRLDTLCAQVGKIIAR